MSQLPFEQLGSLRIGRVSFVSSSEIKVVLDSEAPESIALNNGVPQPFPRVNSYLLIPVDDMLLVGQVQWVTVENSPSPRRSENQKFDLVDLPYPLRKLSLNPLGSLQIQSVSTQYVFQRGTDTLPSVGASVILPTENQLRSIIESGNKRCIRIGSSPLAGGANVYIDPNKLFGRHLAVLGNTGSGKSCSVAGLIRWSIEQAQRERGDHPNARFIILDPNGEYSRAFSNGETVKARIFKVEPGDHEIPLRAPLWLWNSAEWSSLTHASARTQRPLLRRALREIKSGRVGVSESTGEEKKPMLRAYLFSRLISINSSLRSGSIQTGGQTKFGKLLRAIADDLEKKNDEFPAAHLDKICNAIHIALKATYQSYSKNGTLVEYYDPFTEAQVQAIIDALKESLDSLGGIIYQEGPGEDVPLPFKGAELADHIEFLANQENVEQYVDFLIARIRTFLSDPTLGAIIDDNENTTLAQWLQDYVGNGQDDGSCISVIDLSLVPSEIVYIVTAVIVRTVFEALQRYVKLNNMSLPTVLIMEEAHTFIKRYREDAENHAAATICCQVFERIAREGRKFGLGLVLSSQRPSELSPVVLSQCNTFLLHRISNDRDQELVSRLVPDNLRGLLRELPSLPSQNAILLGWASKLPVFLKMKNLPKEQQPRSDDPNFWNVWTAEQIHSIDWNAIADDWQERAENSNADAIDKGTEDSGASIDKPSEENLSDDYDLPF